MPWWVYVLPWVVFGALALRRANSGQPCDHDWGIADAETGWDQKCRKCGAWRSGYGRTW